MQRSGYPHHHHPLVSLSLLLCLSPPFKLLNAEFLFLVRRGLTPKRQKFNERLESTPFFLFLAAAALLSGAQVRFYASAPKRLKDVLCFP